jgi:hypothetical protein
MNLATGGRKFEEFSPPHYGKSLALVELPLTKSNDDNQLSAAIFVFCGTAS